VREIVTSPMFGTSKTTTSDGDGIDVGVVPVVEGEDDDAGTTGGAPGSGVAAAIVDTVVPCGVIGVSPGAGRTVVDADRLTACGETVVSPVTVDTWTSMSEVSAGAAGWAVDWSPTGVSATGIATAVPASALVLLKMLVLMTIAEPAATMTALTERNVAVGVFILVKLRSVPPTDVEAKSKSRPISWGIHGGTGRTSSRDESLIGRASSKTERMRILVVEDDDAIAASLAVGLEKEGHHVVRVADGASAVAARDYDLMLLDVGLPDIDGFEVCRTVRSSSQVPIIMLTARADEIDRVVGLESGADDYVGKPFSLRELVARIKAVTRRGAYTGDPTETRFGSLVIDHARRKVTVDGRGIVLTAKEFDLLEFLARGPEVVHRRLSIMESVWDTEWFGSTKTLDAHVASLRKKLGDPRWVEAVRGVGFRLVALR